jgi:hypothetical protein
MAAALAERDITVVSGGAQTTLSQQQLICDRRFGPAQQFRRALRGEQISHLWRCGA